MCRPWLTAAAAAGSAPRCSCSRGGRAGADSAAEPSESWHGSPSLVGDRAHADIHLALPPASPRLTQQPAVWVQLADLVLHLVSAPRLSRNKLAGSAWCRRNSVCLTARNRAVSARCRHACRASRHILSPNRRTATWSGCPGPGTAAVGSE
ncbi:hypothetical protein PR001_g20118 [Phytophthora rubi]|uniref:Uncharacterized protein n=1 Tax=Phytophthora rubi TaxID=129364 RepID=A0A6A3JN35_9STRA|nr:hypothetical protein PR001_g20118 [Phytophthora rubi]KAE9045404.1 hypothetical protein PR002_g2258 [Phytophthora rubi]